MAIRIDLACDNIYIGYSNFVYHYAKYFISCHILRITRAIHREFKNIFLVNYFT